MEDECGAPEMFTGGAKLVGINGQAGKIAPTDLKSMLADFPRGLEKQVQPAALSLSQVTECGTIYTCAQLAELAAIAHDAGLMVHMDGARFANALVSLQCSPAEMSWKAGIDVLSFGATKNGALACEAAIFFDSSRAKSLPFQRKRSGHTLSKGRFLGAQMAAYLENGHWLVSRRRRTAMRGGLPKGWETSLASTCLGPARGMKSSQFFHARSTVRSRRQAHSTILGNFTVSGARFAPPAENEVFVRLVTSFATLPSDVDRFLALARSAGPDLI